MLSQDELLAWYQQLNATNDARLEVNRVRSSGPSRRVGGGGSNVSGRYPSQKMAVTIQFESHRVELAFVREKEHDADVLEYYDQPPSFPLDYKTAKGRCIRVFHTPDFFVMRRTAAGWEECKTEEELEKLSEKSPNRYSRDEKGTWRCPPGERHARRFGLYYRVRSSKEINWVVQRNLQFLDDYLCIDASQADRSGREWGLAMVSAEPGISLSELFRRAAEGISRDDIYALIATRKLYVDLGTAPLAEAERVHVFVNREAAVACGHAAQAAEAPTDNCRVFTVRAGLTVAWDGRTWTIVNPGDKTISLLGEDDALTELPASVLRSLPRRDESMAYLQDKKVRAGRRSLCWLQRTRWISVSPIGASTLSSANCAGSPRQPTAKCLHGPCAYGCHAIERRRLVLAAGISDSYHAVVTEETAGAGFRRRPRHLCSNPSRMITRR